jgi:DNA polymerase I-like protein with 3'-5' exonuclease and polymerase domains
MSIVGSSLESFLEEAGIHDEVYTNSKVRVAQWNLGEWQEAMGMKMWEGVRGGRYYLVDTLDKFAAFMAKAASQPAFAVDTETSGLDWVKARACGVVIGWGVENNYYLPIDHKDFDTGERLNQGQLNIEDIVERLNELLSDSSKVKILWNAKFDLHALKVIGVEVGGVIHDGLISSFLLDENCDHSLKGMSKRFVDRKADLWEKDINTWRVDESKRRRKLLSAMIKSTVGELKSDPRMVASAHQTANEQIEALDLAGMPPASVKRKKTSFINAAHKERAKAKLKHHYYNRNKKDQISYDLIPIDDMVPYACADVHYTWLLHKKFFNALAEDKALVQLYINEMQLCRVLFGMEQAGLKTNREYLVNIGPELIKEAYEAEQEVYRQVGYEFNIGSTQQLVDAIKSVGITLTKYTKTSQEKIDRGEITEKEATFSADSAVLEILAATHPFAKAVLDYRGALKIKSTYIDGILDKLDDNDFIHASFTQNVKTGRMSSRAPNLQNIPSRDKRVKKSFIVPDDDHVFVFIDYSQIEVRLVAHYSQDPLLLSCYPFEGEGRDVHSLTTSEVIMGMDYDEFLGMRGDKTGHENNPLCTCNYCMANDMRRIGKTINFLIIYGGGGGVLQTQISTPEKPVDITTCKEYIKGYMRKYRGVQRWINLTENDVLRKLHVQNVFGRYRRFPDINHVDDKGRYRRLRQAANFLIQGSAADLFKYALVRVNKFIKGTGIKIVNVVHDDIQFYFPKNKLHMLKDVVRIMEDFQFTVPIIADVEVSDTTWSDKVEVPRELLDGFTYEAFKELVEGF